MSNPTEQQLRDLLAAEAAAAPPAVGLAEGALRRVRHRRRVMATYATGVLVQQRPDDLDASRQAGAVLGHVALDQLLAGRIVHLAAGLESAGALERRERSGRGEQRGGVGLSAEHQRLFQAPPALLGGDARPEELEPTVDVVGEKALQRLGALERQLIVVSLRAGRVTVPDEQELAVRVLVVQRLQAA